SLDWVIRAGPVVHQQGFGVEFPTGVGIRVIDAGGWLRVGVGVVVGGRDAVGGVRVAFDEVAGRIGERVDAVHAVGVEVVPLAVTVHRERLVDVVAVGVGSDHGITAIALFDDLLARVVVSRDVA